MSIEYLDKAGAVKIVSKIKELLNTKVEGAKKNDTVFTVTDNVIDLAPLATEKMVLDTSERNYNAITSAEDRLNDRITTSHNVLDNKITIINGQIDKLNNNKQNVLTFNTAYNATTNKAATMKDITNAIGSITGIEFVVVETLPETGQRQGTIYLVAHAHGTNDSYDEYVWLKDSSKWEKIGTTDIDLSNYVSFDDLIAITETEINAMFA